jgi:hypothetical protein
MPEATKDLLKSAAYYVDELDELQFILKTQARY